MKTYATLILSYLAEPYTYFDKCKIQICKGKQLFVKNILNSSEPFPVGEDELLYIYPQVDFLTDRFCLLPKFLWAYDQLKETLKGYDYIIRTNSSTFLNFDLLDRYIQNLPTTGCYAGSVAYDKFISGGCIIMSNDVVDKIVTSPMRNDYVHKNDHVLDDVTIGRIMMQNGVEMRHIPMYQFADLTSIPQDDEIINSLKTHAMIRIKNIANRNVIDKYIWTKLTEATIKKYGV